MLAIVIHLWESGKPTFVPVFMALFGLLVCCVLIESLIVKAGSIGQVHKARQALDADTLLRDVDKFVGPLLTWGIQPDYSLKDKVQRIPDGKSVTAENTIFVFRRRSSSPFVLRPSAHIPMARDAVRYIVAMEEDMASGGARSPFYSIAGTVRVLNSTIIDWNGRKHVAAGYFVGGQTELPWDKVERWAYGKFDPNHP